MKLVWPQNFQKSRSNAVVIAVAATLAIHAAVLFALWFSPKFHESQMPPASPIEVEFVASSQATRSGKASGTSVPSTNSGSKTGSRLEQFSAETEARAQSRSSKLQRLQIAPSFKPNFATDTDSDVAMNDDFGARDSDDSRVRGSDREGSDYIDNPRAEWGSGGSDFGRVADFVRLDRLYRSVDSRLIYPSILAYKGISGTVNARLVITKKGCDWNHTQISASEPHLRVYILDVLQRTCHANLTEFARADRASNVDLSFSFAQTEHNDSGLIETQRKIVGNVLLFYRNSHASVAEWKLGPIRGMFPIPAVSVDFVWLKLNWDKFVGAPDPMAEYREKTGSKPAG